MIRVSDSGLFTEEIVEQRLRDLRLSSSFSFGVSTAGFQVEGGYNGPGEPRNNWYEWEARGHVERSGSATDSWSHYEEDLRAVAAIGCDAYNFSIEWARVQPSTDGGQAQPSVDAGAIAHYATMIAAGRACGIEPIVALHHFTHPRWLGLDFWLRSDSPDTFRRYVAAVVPRLGRELLQRGQRPVRRWVTLTEINVLALQTWFTAEFPGGGPLRTAAAARALDHLLAAHILAYDELHDIYERERWARPEVTLSTYTFAIYEIGQALVDVLLARRRGVEPDRLQAHLAERRAWFGDRVARLGGPSDSVIERAMSWLATRTPHAWDAAADALYGSARADKLDAIAFSFYDPWLGGRLLLPGRRTDGGRTLSVARRQWEDPPRPETLQTFCRSIAEDTEQLPLWLLENGLCSRMHHGRSAGRKDGWTRARYLLEHLDALAQAVASGIPIEVYLHWTLYDNYEWGSYEPRFGLFAFDRTRMARLPHDAMGDDAAGAYRQMIDQLRGPHVTDWAEPNGNAGRGATARTVRADSHAEYRPG